MAAVGEGTHAVEAPKTGVGGALSGANKGTAVGGCANELRPERIASQPSQQHLGSLHANRSYI